MTSSNPTDAGPALVIIGAAGRLGGALVKRYSSRYRTLGLARQHLDLSDPQSILRALEPLRYDRLVITGALTAVDYCEDHPEEAYAINAEAPRLISEISAAKGAHVTYISTDFVFDGAKVGNYSEEDAAHPISVYGASKLEGEEHVLAVSPTNLVARVSWLYGSGKPAFPEWIISQAQKLDELALPGEKTGTPTYTEDVVSYLKLLIGLEGGEPASGIVHVSNSGACSWQEWGQECLNIAAASGVELRTRKIEANSLDDVAAFKAKRPVNSVLDVSKLEKITGIAPRSWKEALSEHLTSGFGRP